MAVTNCRRCGKLFNRVGRGICPSCVKEDDEAYKAVREYLRHHKDVYLTELAEATEVPEEWVVEMVHDGRLILTGYPNLFTTCENCGAQIQSGRFCKDCSDKLNEAFTTAAEDIRQKAQEEKRRDRGGYYIRDNTFGKR